MKEFVEKLKSRLEERRNEENNNSLCEMNENGHTLDFECSVGKTNAFNESISIVNELAEEYKDKLDDEWQNIYNKILNLEKKYANDGNTESVNDCIKLENLLQYFKEELRSEEEYINTSTDTSGGWIPCSERLPEGNDDVMVMYTDNDGEVDICCLDWFLAYSDIMLALMPLPEPYKPQESEWKNKVMKHFTNVE